MNYSGFSFLEVFVFNGMFCAMCHGLRGGAKLKFVQLNLLFNKSADIDPKNARIEVLEKSLE